ncbi:MAG: aspartate dehydrogenase [Hyphomicrobiales bacterium]|nr:MAG: aspartate dehydrogenase [Hyphomicrobiales bacterium]
MSRTEEYTLAIAGLGAIGLRVAEAVDRGEVPGIRLTAVSASDQRRAHGRLAGLAHPPAIVSLGELAGLADIIVECTPAKVFAEVAGPAVEQGRILIPLSVAALLDHMDLVERARVTGARIIVPTGALIGLDTVRAMAEGEISRVVLETRKPPGGLAGAAHLVENCIDISNLSAPLRVFHGTAREAARGFPANVNVAAALALAGIGPDRTEVTVWADPAVDRNIQTVTITSDAGDATMTMRNVPSASNPKTGRIVAQSVLATLRRLTATLTAGS